MQVNSTTSVRTQAPASTAPILLCSVLKDPMEFGNNLVTGIEDVLVVLGLPAGTAVELLRGSIKILWTETPIGGQAEGRSAKFVFTGANNEAVADSLVSMFNDMKQRIKRGAQMHGNQQVTFALSGVQSSSVAFANFARGSVVNPGSLDELDAMIRSAFG